MATHCLNRASIPQGHRHAARRARRSSRARKDERAKKLAAGAWQLDPCWRASATRRIASSPLARLALLATARPASHRVMEAPLVSQLTFSIVGTYLEFWLKPPRGRQFYRAKFAWFLFCSPEEEVGCEPPVRARQEGRSFFWSLVDGGRGKRASGFRRKPPTPEASLFDCGVAQSPHFVFAARNKRFD